MYLQFILLPFIDIYIYNIYIYIYKNKQDDTQILSRCFISFCKRYQLRILLICLRESRIGANFKQDKKTGECLNQALCIHQTTYWGHKILRIKTLFLPLSQLAGVNTTQTTNRNMLIKVKVNIAFTRAFFKSYSMSFLKIFRLIHFAHVLLQLLMLKVCAIIGV